MNTVGNLSISENQPHSNVVIQKKDIEKIKEWFNLLTEENFQRLKIPLQRIKSAIYENKSLDDSTLDAFIAWKLSLVESRKQPSK